MFKYSAQNTSSSSLSLLPQRQKDQKRREYLEKDVERHKKTKVLINLWETEDHVISILLSFAALQITLNFSRLKQQKAFIIPHVFCE